jgi:hypothetical protein
MPPIRLSDDELSAVMAAARPLDVAVRDAFLQRVAGELGRCGEIGPGVVHRVCAETQRAFFDPSDLTHPSRRAGWNAPHSPSRGRWCVISGWGYWGALRAVSPWLAAAAGRLCKPLKSLR